MLGAASLNGWSIAGEIRWKRFILPHGTRQLPKSRVSRSTRTIERRQLVGSTRVARQPHHRDVARLVGGRRQPFEHLVPPDHRQRLRFGGRAPAIIPAPQQRDRLRQASAPRVAAVSASNALISGGTSVAKARLVGVERGGLELVEGPAAATGQQLLHMEAAEILAERVHVARETRRVRG